MPATFEVPRDTLSSKNQYFTYTGTTWTQSIRARGARGEKPHSGLRRTLNTHGALNQAVTSRNLLVQRTVRVHVVVQCTKISTCTKVIQNVDLYV